MKNESNVKAVRMKIMIVLLIATAGVIVQIAAGAPYPPVPPVFFILLIPAALIRFVNRAWVPFVSLFAALFLTLGLFSSGAYRRLFHAPNPVDAVGLWIQSVAVLLAITLSIIALGKKRALLA